ncbi:MAG: RIO1 family regulatory kinase/ATPase, partial [Dehalococcoidia bacterium]
RLTGNAMLMEFIGDADGAAPKLHEVTLRPEEVRPLFDRVMRNVELLMRLNCIHGDLSAYNILYWHGSLTIIDFPQTVDPRANPHAFELLTRDMENVYRYWSRYELKANPTIMAHHLWNRFQRSEL